MFLAASAWFLHVLGRTELASPPVLDPGALSGWLEATGPAIAVVAVVRLLALGLVWYLVVGTVVGSLVRVSEVAAASALTDRMIPQFLRSLLGSAGTLTAAGLTLAVSPLLTPGSGSLDTAVVAVAGETSGSNVSPPLSNAAGPGGPIGLFPVDGGDEPIVLERIDAPLPPDAPTPLEIAALAALAPVPRSETWLVEPGDHLWHIAAETLNEVWDRPPTDDEVTGYWIEVIDVNRDNLVVPDDPDLIYPGQRMLLPPVPPPS